MDKLFHPNWLVLVCTSNLWERDNLSTVDKTPTPQCVHYTNIALSYFPLQKSLKIVFWLQIKKNQQKMFMILDGKKIQYEQIDVAASEEAKKKMRELIGDPKALPPQIFNGDTYCGVGLE